MENQPTPHELSEAGKTAVWRYNRGMSGELDLQLVKINGKQEHLKIISLTVSA